MKDRNFFKTCKGKQKEIEKFRPSKVYAWKPAALTEGQNGRWENNSSLKYFT